MKEKIIRIENLTKAFPTGKRNLFGKQKNFHVAVNNVSLDIYRGETLGLVGESGCGKSTLGRTILRLIESDSGNIFFKDKNIQLLNNNEMKRLREKIQIIFQNPYSSLNPRLTVSQTMTEVLRVHNLETHKEMQVICDLLELVGLPRDSLYRYPYEFSGGQLQRLAITRSLLLKPEFLIADEPVSALDVSIQAKILNLLTDLKEKFSLTMLFIAHDLSVVEYMSDRIAVMYLGNIVEIAQTQELFSNVMHPYTKALISSIPVLDPNSRNEKVIIEGDLPNPTLNFKGCRFESRCSKRMDICKQVTPKLININDNHAVSCHLHNEAVIKNKKTAHIQEVKDLDYQKC